jgi:hypothetical protein
VDIPFAALHTLVVVAQFYYGDPFGSATPVLPAVAVPQEAGGILIPPGPPSAKYVFASLAAAGRRPGDRIVEYHLVDQKVEGLRPYRVTGAGQVWGSIWRLTYCCRVNGPGGPYSLYVDRTALLRED